MVGWVVPQIRKPLCAADGEIEKWRRGGGLVTRVDDGVGKLKDGGLIRVIERRPGPQRSDRHRDDYEDDDDDLQLSNEGFRIRET